MSKNLVIKNNSISSDCASIFVPVVSKTEESIVNDVKHCIEAGVSFIEFRADYFEGLRDKDALGSLLASLNMLCSDTVLLFTIRTSDEGGLAEIDEKEYLSIIRFAAMSGAIDLVDCEISKLSEPSLTIKELKEYGVNVVASHHNFSSTYDKERIHSIYDDMRIAGADILKLAMMPVTKMDVLNLLLAAEEYKEANDDCLLVAISMGELGKPTRVIGSYVGSCITFAALTEASAPGQIGFSELGTVLGILNY